MKLKNIFLVIFAIIGIVSTITALFLFIFFFTSKQIDEIKVKEQVNIKGTAKNIVYYFPIITPYSDYAIFPIRVDNLAERGSEVFSELYSDTSVSKRGSIYHSSGNYNNMFFYNKKTSKSHLLLDKKALIHTFYFPYEKENYKEKPVPKFLLFSISDNDSNSDNLINEKDEKIGFLSDLSGTNITQITPRNSQLIDWQIDTESKIIFLRIKNDSDNNKKFTLSDSMSILRVNIEKPTMGTEIISQNIHNTIGEMFGK